jgi:prepilin-type N-terminal cleavage/methylation domain-containing protein
MSPNGLTMVEVMVAIVILGIAIGTLAGSAQRALSATVKNREKAADPLEGDAALVDTTPWAWGPTIERATWAAGPVLSIRSGSGMGVGGVVGVWTDGWLVGDWRLSAGMELCLGPERWGWGDRAGEELVVRARAGNGAWGPPWRSVVPDSYGNGTPEAIGAPTESENVLEYGDAGSVAHLRSCSNASLLASWTNEPVLRSLEGLVLVLSAQAPGVCRLESYGRCQAWVGSAGRGLDVYF